MKKISSIITNFLLYLGVIVLIGAFIFAMIVNRQNHNFIFDVLPFFVAISGIFVLIFGFVYTKKAYHIFTGLMLFTWGIIIFLIMKEYIKRDLYQLWPLIGITTGIFLYISGMYKYKKVKFGYFIPALSLFLLSTWFLLFSLKNDEQILDCISFQHKNSKLF